MEFGGESARAIGDFWFGAAADDKLVASQQTRLWWIKNPDTDQRIRERFAGTTAAAARGELNGWARQPAGLLALILLTDQFPRNMYRNTPAAFAHDALAQQWALDGLARGIDQRMRPIERVFMYLPLEHAESPQLQARSVELFTRLFQDVPAQHVETFRGFLVYALRHRSVISRFGRFPHRNAILGRESTPEEREFLAKPGSSF
ncbi:MAG: DUF924 domain-containing protein [Pseudomonadota bacterium]|nr:DUF924 domain-containing protein [Pseudomonadota bacterium]